MRYFSVILLLTLSFIHPDIIRADDGTVGNSKSAPMLVVTQDSVAAVPLQSGMPDTIAYTTVPPSVQDTVLPPCDIIFFKSGKLEYCKVIENSPTTISYKMCDYAEGATIVVNKSTVHKIRYANGREEIITAEVQQQTEPQKNAYVKPRKDPLAKLSLIFGLCAVGIAFLFAQVFLPLVLAAIVLGIISLAKISKRKGEFRGKGAAITGIVLSVLLLILIAL